MVTIVAPPPRRWRNLLFRVLAIGIGLMPLAACEAILWALDLGRPSAHDDPFVGFSAVRPLFERNKAGTRYRSRGRTRSSSGATDSTRSSRRKSSAFSAWEARRSRGIRSRSRPRSRPGSSSAFAPPTPAGAGGSSTAPGFPMQLIARRSLSRSCSATSPTCSSFAPGTTSSSRTDRTPT